MQDELVAAMITGIATDPPWQDFVALVRRALVANHANVIFRRADSHEAPITQSFEAGMPDGLAIRERYNSADDPIPYYKMVPFRAYSLAEFIDGPDFMTHPFVHDFLQRTDMHNLLICRAQTTNGMQAWLSATRPGERPFGDDDRSFLEGVTRLFAHALHLFGVQKSAEDQRDAYARVVRSRATGLIQLDQKGLVLHVDEIAEALIRQSDTLCVSHQLLRAKHAAQRVKLNQALEGILAGKEEEEVVILDGEGGDTAQLLLFRASDLFEPAWMKSPRVIVYLSLTGHEALPSPQRLRTLFGLTRKEAALTVLLARGMTIAEASQALSVSEGTARIYLKSVFAKVGVNRQAELIRRIQTGIAAIE